MDSKSPIPWIATFITILTGLIAISLIVQDFTEGYLMLVLFGVMVGISIRLNLKPPPPES